jgi:CRISPR type IV-associated DEAD/DEAH-box helicase Csf4
VKDKATRAALQEFRRKFGWLEREGASPYTFTTRLYFTPSRRYPLVEREKLNVNRELTFLWKYVSNGVLTSATLYLHTSSGYAMHNMRKELRVPAARARAMRPICPHWVTDPVTVFLPPARPAEEHIDDLLVPPKYDAELIEWSVYYDRIAAFIERRWADKTAGGTLMLMTSFAAIDEVGSRLCAGPLADRVMMGVRRESFRQRAKQYLKATAEDRAPIWLATGRAWTGLDLSIGDRARDDHAIDYLVVPRLPVLLNCSARHRERVLGGDGVSHFGAREVWQCSRQLRQGVGRLVRQRGVPEKELYVLDGRMSWAIGRSFCSLRGNFSGYANREELLLVRDGRPAGSAMVTAPRRRMANLIRSEN